MGLFGFIQSLMLMETFRNINATMGIFISGLFLFKNGKVNQLLQKNTKIIFGIIGVYIILLTTQFPLTNYAKKLCKF